MSDVRVGDTRSKGLSPQFRLQLSKGGPLERVQVEEGAAYGAALLGGVVGGMWRDPIEAVEACVRVRDVIEPDPGWVAVYESVRERFRALYGAVRPWSG